MDNDRRWKTSGAAPLPSAAIAGQATFEGCLTAVRIARHAVLAMLPPSVTLHRGSAATVPCLLVFGEQQNGTTFFGGMTVPWGLRYHELMVAIPFVGWDHAPGEHLFVSGMTCDFWPAVWNGNFYYGFKKRLARMSWDGERFSVEGERRNGGFHATLRRRGQAKSRVVDWIRSAAGLPVLGCRADGVFVHSRFDWDFRDAEVDAATLALSLGPHFAELQGARRAGHNDACWVRRMQWRLSWPEVAAQTAERRGTQD